MSRLAARMIVVLALVALAPSRAAAQGATLPDGFVDQLVASPLSQPSGMAFLPDGRLLVVEQRTGRIRLIVNDAIAAIDPYQVQNVNASGNERGLLGIAVDPGWPARPYLYVHVTHTPPTNVRVTRYTAQGDLAFTSDGAITIDPLSRYDLITDIPDNASNHNGGTVRFGPDGMLYVSIGEDASACLAQDSTSLRGEILRLDVSRLPGGGGGPPARALITPADNPFADGGNANAGLVWAFGLRNPFRFVIDAPTGDLFIGDVGETNYEEVDWVTTGGLDLGWPVREGPAPYTSACQLQRPATDPIVWYQRTVPQAAVICAGLYRRPAGAPRPFPSAYEGDLFFSDYYDGGLRRYERNGNTWTLGAPVLGQPSAGNWAEGLGHVSDYAIGPDGALWYCRQFDVNNTGQIRRIVASNVEPDTLPPTAITFSAPIPMPAQDQVHLSYALPSPGRVRLVIYDLRGREVRRLVELDSDTPGYHRVTWNGLDEDRERVPPGVYFAQLRVDGFSFERRIVLTR